MRINSEKSLALGKRLHEEFGSWEKVREAADYLDGVYVLRPRRANAEKADRKLPSKP